ncbi:hypothetical protein B0H19DRAFT_1276831 [Mycena capillaripes]|nr:hypothetical protein B0H19DRAFT_1276831 [Mycena capillaripes]
MITLSGRTVSSLPTNGTRDWRMGAAIYNCASGWGCDPEERYEASLAWALNDVFGDVFWIGGAFKISAQGIGDTGQLMGPILVKVFVLSFATIKFAKARAAAWEKGGDLSFIGKGVGMAFGLIGVVLLPSVSQHQLSTGRDDDPPESQDPERASVWETFDYFSSISSQCSQLYIQSDSFPYNGELLDALRRSTHTRLRSITFVWYFDRLPSRLLGVRAMDFPFVGGEVHGVSTLRLFDARFCWEPLARFTGLTTLVLHFQYADNPPTIDQLASIMRSNPRLVRMSMRLHVSGLVSSSPLQPVFLPELTELDLDFNGDSSVAILMAECHFTRLRVLNYAAALTGSVRQHDAPKTHSVLAALPSLVYLDLTAINGLIFKEALSRTLDRTNPVCPRLSTLSVLDFTSRDVRAIVAARSHVHRPLKGLNCFNLYPSGLGGRRSYASHLLDLEYICGSVDELNVDISSEEDWDFTWCLR